MGQTEVLEILKEKYPEWIKSKEISEILKINHQSVSKNLRKLISFGDVENKYIGNRNGYLYRLKKS